MEAGKFLQLVALLAAVSLTGVFHACSKSDSKNDTVVVATLVSPITLDPRLAIDAESKKISELVCDGLLSTNEKQELVPNLAGSYEMPSDTVYLFHLREGVKFHDGTPLTADDVAYTFNSIIDGKIASALLSTYEKLKSVTAESQYTVRFELKEPYSPFLSSLFLGIVSKSAASAKDNSFGLVPICTGAYKVKRFLPDVAVELEENKDYYGKRPKTPNLKFLVVKDDNVRFLKLMRGDVDLVQNGISPILIDAILSRSGLKKVEGQGTVTTYIGFNLSDPALSKRPVRQAIAYAIDRDSIIEHKWRGLATKANSIIAPSNWAYDRGLMQYPYDPEMAMKLLDEAGLKDPDGNGPKKRFHIIYKTSTNRDRVDIARMIAHWLEKVGIGVTVEPYEWSTFFHDVRVGNFQMYALSWVGITDPNLFYEACHSSQFAPNGLNRVRYKNPEMDRLTDAARSVSDTDKRRALYSKAERILLEDLPYLPLWYEKNYTIYHDYLTGVTAWPDASYKPFIEIEKKQK